MNAQLEFLKAQISLLEKRIDVCSKDADSKEYASLMRLYLSAVKEYGRLTASEETETDELLAFAMQE